MGAGFSVGAGDRVLVGTRVGDAVAGNGVIEEAEPHDDTDKLMARNKPIRHKNLVLGMVPPSIKVRFAFEAYFILYPLNKQAKWVHLR